MVIENYSPASRPDSSSKPLNPAHIPLNLADTSLVQVKTPPVAELSFNPSLFGERAAGSRAVAGMAFIEEVGALLHTKGTSAGD